MQAILAFLQPTAAVVSSKKRRLHFYLRTETTLCGHIITGNTCTDIGYNTYCLHQKNILGCIKNSMTRVEGDDFIPVLNFGEIPLEYCIWGPQHSNNTDLLEQAQKRATKMIQV